MQEWAELDTKINTEVADLSVKNGMLDAHITVLKVKRLIVSQTPVDDVQQLLKERFNVEYDPVDVQLAMEPPLDETVVYPDDYFNGF